MTDFLFLCWPLIFLSCMGSLLGCCLLWQRSTFVGEALSHGAFLGVGLSLLWQRSPEVINLVLCVILSLVLGYGSIRRGPQAWPDHFNALSHGFVAVGLLLLSCFPYGLSQAEMILFGDVLSLSLEKSIGLSLFYACGSAILLIIMSPMIAINVSVVLARAEKVPVMLLTFIFFGLLGLFVGLSLSLVGLFLLMGVMLFPAITAHWIARSPWSMVLYAQGLGVVNTMLGFGISLYYDWAVGPAIVVVHLVVYLIVCATIGSIQLVKGSVSRSNSFFKTGL